MKKALATTFAATMMILGSVGEASAEPCFTYPIKDFRITQYASSHHMAIDFQSKHHDKAFVGAIGSGKVVKTCRGYCSGWGYYVEVDHGNGFKSLYAHLSGISVEVGQRVGKFQKVGNMGKTGRVHARYPVLHLEVYKNGIKINPLRVIN